MHLQNDPFQNIYNQALQSTRCPSVKFKHLDHSSQYYQKIQEMEQLSYDFKHRADVSLQEAFDLALLITCSSLIDVYNLKIHQQEYHPDIKLEAHAEALTLRAEILLESALDHEDQEIKINYINRSLKASALARRILTDQEVNRIGLSMP